MGVIPEENISLSERVKPGAREDARSVMGLFGANKTENKCTRPPNDPTMERAPILAPGFFSF